MQKNSRINILDSFRCIAILSVILFHYYSFPPRDDFKLYSYGNKYSFFSYGYLGVEFFFIISGFVITYTLSVTPKIGEFWKKRIIRLFPAMFICSLLTFLFLFLFDTNNIFPESHNIVNFIYSLTFITPTILERTPLHNINYINGSYWSLWPEIQFYFIASLVYYYKPSRFTRNFSLIVILLCIAYWLNGNVYETNLFHLGINTFYMKIIRYLLNIFNIGKFILWFFIGVLFFKLYSKEYNKYTIITLCLAILILLLNNEEWKVQLIILIMIGIFLIFILYPPFSNWFDYKIITDIGLASYTLYLIHENIGVLLINRFAGYWGRFDFLFPVLVIVIFIVFSLLSYKSIETPINRLLKKWFLGRDNNK
jgi:peptidoglycan/LPS O-acetylase OafA/YrhL